jgi:hypothetical protein
MKEQGTRCMAGRGDFLYDDEEEEEGRRGGGKERYGLRRCALG